MKKNLKFFMLCSISAACFILAAAPAGRPAVPARVGQVKNAARNISRKYIAKISAVDDVSLIARVPGVILEQKFAHGDMVKKGQELIIIEDTTYVAARNSAKAKLQQCVAEYDFAKRNLARQQTLWKNKATAESTYDEAVRSEAIAKAAVDAAKAALLDAENNLSYTKIISPISGKTGKAAFSPGNYVTSSSGTLINIVSMDEMYVNFFISMSDYMSIFGGSFDTLRKEGVAKIITADGKEFAGKADIVFIDNRVDKDTDTIRVRLRVKNDNMILLPDSLVSVRLSRADKPRPTVPVSAVMNNGKMSYVYVLDEKNIAQIRPVELGEVQGKNQIILNGLRAGERVVFDGTHKIFPGSEVAPVPVAKAENK
ncbi:MAG: efflux RND transporter periplasmic adaptor subunit [Lentisphaerae bacterium]|nr:efflux RND transporter periplasmic adaptor subunit [Lentisphaerota bacterium]